MQVTDPGGFSMSDQRADTTVLSPPSSDVCRAHDRSTSALQSYAAPRLVALGDLRDLTLGGSVGRADSGAPARQARVGGI